MQILMAVDSNSIEDKQILEPLLQIAKTQKASVIILNVKTDKGREPYLNMTEKSKLAGYFKNIPISFHTISNSYVAEDIHKFAILHEVNMIGVFPKGHGFLDRLFNKSITKQLVFYTDIPLLAMKGKADPDYSDLMK